MLLVILDLDETLVHAADEPLDGLVADFNVGTWPVYVRPGAREFIASLTALDDVFELAVWTSASASYAALVVEHLFGTSAATLRFVWSASRCSIRFDGEMREYTSIKNLHKLRRKGHRLERVIIVDDTPSKHVRNYGNLVRVTEWTGDPTDHELQHLLPYLQELSEVDNVRRVEKRDWRRRAATTTKEAKHADR